LKLAHAFTKYLAAVLTVALLAFALTVRASAWPLSLTLLGVLAALLLAATGDALQADGRVPEAGSADWAFDQERYRRIVETTNEGIWEIDGEACVTYVNRAMAAMLGYGIEEMLGRSAFEFMAEDDVSRARAFLDRRRQGLADHYNLRLRRKDGSTLWTAVNATPLIDERGRYVGAFAMVSDITERKQAQATLKVSEKRFRLLVDQLPLSLQIVDPSGRIVRVNRAWEELWGVTLEQIPEYNLLQDQQLIDRGLMPHILRAFQGEAIESPPIPYTPDRGKFEGQERWTQAILYPVLDEHGSLSEVVLIHEDITDHKRAEDAEKATTERLNLALAAADLGSWSWDTASDIVTPSARAAEIFGIPTSPGLTWTQMQGLLHEADREHARQAVEKSVAARSRCDIEYRVNRPDGTQVWVAALGRAYYDDNGAALGMFGIVQDITERKQLEQALAQRATEQAALYEFTDRLQHAESFSEIYDAALNAILDALSCDRASLLLFDDAGVMRFVGWRGLSSSYRQATEGHSPWKTDARDPRPVCISDIAEADIAEPLKTVVYDAGIRALGFIPLVTNGRLIGKFMIYYDTPHSFHEAEIDLALTIARQIAFGVERKRAEEALNRERELLQTIIDKIPVMITVYEPDTKVLRLNRAFERLVGWSSSEVTGMSLMEKCYPADEYRALVGEFMQSCRDGWMDIQMRTRDGRDIETSWANIRLSDRTQVGIGIDIGERKRAEQEREQLLLREKTMRAEAERANRLKDEFLATVSHELRTPLNAILGWATILQSGDLDETAQSHALETIERNARSQAQLVDDLLDVSRIISGKLRLKVGPADLIAVIRAAADAVHPAVTAKQIRLELVMDPAIGDIQGDATRLQQIVWNLLSNAVKFTPRGGTVRLALERVDNKIQIAVSDTGEGISPEFLPYVFDRFQQADGTSTRRHGGLGLGLAIVRHLVEMHGGTIEAISAGAGRGSTFTVRLPVAHVPSTAPPVSHETGIEAAKPGDTPRKPARLSGLRILVVDDEADSRELLDSILRQDGVETMSASGAADALEVLRHQRPDVLVSDIAMPEEDGYSLMSKVRALEAEDTDQLAPVRAIALTAYARTEDRLRALEAGYDMFLPKPVEPEELVSTIANLTQRPQAC
jgi:PAS domain S-box-containing protein